jgi:TonB-linked SusC/RagA family outer membrane protein
MKRLRVFLACIVFVGVNYLQAQTVQITGTVTSAEDGKPVIGASVVVKGTTIGTATDIDGNYLLSVPQTATTLEVSFVGMITQDVVIGGRNVVNVILKTDAQELEEVIVVAYGTSKRESFTGSAKAVDAKTLEKRTVTSVTKALDGAIPGVQSTSGGGQPGANSNIRIRGFGSINASNSPLYVVDGIPYDGNVNAINPDDIASVSVLKDASASALYGARGANGVIIITTKRGAESREPEVRFKAVFGQAERTSGRYETVTTDEYMELLFEAYRNQLINEGNSFEAATTIALNGDDEANLQSFMGVLGGEQYNPYNIPSNQLIDPTTGKIVPNATLLYSDDWYQEALRENPFRNDYQLSVTGGTDKSKYLFSMGYLNDNGIVENSKFTRITNRINLDSQVKEWMKAGMSASYSLTKQNYLMDQGSSYSNIWHTTLTMAPLYPVYQRNADGTFLLDSDGNKQYDYGGQRAYNPNFNTIATLFDDSRSLNADNLSGRTYVDFDTDKDIPFIKDLKFTINFGFDYRGSDQLIYYNPVHGNAMSIGGAVYKTNNRTLSYTLNQLLNYSKKFDQHSIDVLLGHEYYDLGYNFFYAEKQGFTFQGITELDGASTTTGSSSYFDTYRVESYLSRLNYNFADRYYFSASFRTDGSSRFHKDSRWGQFWSVGGSWRVSEESFMKPVTWINNMTLKASYGSQGNDMLLKADENPNYYAWQSFYSTDWANNNMGGVWLTSLENKEVEWEKNNNLNIGIDARLFDRLSLGAEYFHKTTSDLLLYRPLATSTGFNGYFDNIGSMVNQGIELDLFGQILTGDFSWGLGTQVSFIKNKVTELVTEDQEIITGSLIIKVGEPINSFYLPTSAGIDPLTGQQLYLIKKQVEVDGVTTYVEEVTNNYNLAAQYKSIHGSRIPNFYGSITNNFAYKNFDLSLLLTYSVGGKVIDNVYNTLFSLRNPGTNLHSHLLRRWQNPGDITDVPKLVLGQVDYVTDAKLVDASYLSIRNVSFGYTLPSSVSKNVGIQSCRFFITGDNLALFTKLQGMDPQYNFQGNQNFSYVPLRVLSLGIDLKF